MFNLLLLMVKSVLLCNNLFEANDDQISDSIDLELAEEILHWLDNLQ